MGDVKQINIKNWNYYFYNDMINLEHFESSLWKIDTKSHKNTGYIIIKNIDDYQSIYSVKPLYLLVNHANAYVKEKNGNKYLIFDSTEENKELLKKYSDFWNAIKNNIEAINSGECGYEKDYMKIKFNSDNSVPLNKPLNDYNYQICFWRRWSILSTSLFRWRFVWVKYTKNASCKQHIKC